MPLRHVLYRCPFCGHDPLQGSGDAAACAGCGASFSRARRGVRVRDAQGERVHSVGTLVEGIRAHGGPVTAATREDGSLHYASPALYHGPVDEEPIRKGGRFLGFAERPGPGRDGLLEVTADALGFSSGGVMELTWPLEALTALQVSTRSLQVGVRSMGTLQFTLQAASTFRWEELLQHLLRQEWRSRGWGEIREFQPRISVR